MKRSEKGNIFLGTIQALTDRIKEIQKGNINMRLQLQSEMGKKYNE